MRLGHPSPRPTQSRYLSHRFVVVSLGVFEESSFCFPTQDHFDVLVLCTVLEVNKNVDQKWQYTYNMPRGRAAFKSSFLTFDTLSVDRYTPVEPIRPLSLEALEKTLKNVRVKWDAGDLMTYS